MFSSIFGKGSSTKEVVEVKVSFVETDCDMGGMERTVNVPKGARGLATISKSGSVTIKMDEVQDPVFSKKLVKNFNSKEQASSKFKFLGSKELL